MHILIYWLSRGIYYQHQIIIKLPNSWKTRLDCAIINKWKNKGGSDFWKCHLHLIYSKKIHINWLYWEGIGHLFPDLKPWELDWTIKKQKLSFRKKLEALSVSIGHIPAVQPPTNMAMYISHFVITWSTSQKSPPPRSPTLKNDLHLRHWATPTCEWCYREGVIWRMFKGVPHPVEPCETSMLLIGWTFQQKRFLNHGETPGEALRGGRFDYNIWLFNIQNSSQRKKSSEIKFSWIQSQYWSKKSSSSGYWLCGKQNWIWHNRCSSSNHLLRGMFPCSRGDGNIIQNTTTVPAGFPEFE